MAEWMAGSIGGRTGPWPGRLVTWLTRLVRLTRLIPWFARFVICLGVTSLLINRTAFAERHETAAAPSTDGKVLGIAYVGRMVADLDKSIPFYEAIGLARDPSVDSSSRRDEALNHLFGIKGARFRTAKLTVNSNILGKPFTVYLHELQGIKRINVGGYPPWEPGASHFGLVVPNAALVWSQLKASGMLRARSWGGELIPFPGETK